MTNKGTCRTCFDEVPLDGDRTRLHARPGSTLRYSTCAGSHQVAHDELTDYQQRLVELIGAAVAMANTSRMSDKNRDRCARAVFWTLRERLLL